MKYILSLVICIIAVVGVAQADSGSVTIISPQNDSTLKAAMDNSVEYEFTKGTRGDHIHIWVDGKKGPAQKSMAGRYTLPKMSKGSHAIIAKVVNKGHVPTGPEKSIFIKVE